MPGRRRRHDEESPIFPGSELHEDSPRPQARGEGRGRPVIPSPDHMAPHRGGARFGRSPPGEMPGLHPASGGHWDYPPLQAMPAQFYAGGGAYLSPNAAAAYAGHTAPRSHLAMYGAPGRGGGFPQGFVPGHQHGANPYPPHPAAAAHGHGPYPPHPGMARHVSAPYPTAPLPPHMLSPMHAARGGPHGSVPMGYVPLDMYGMGGMGGMDMYGMGGMDMYGMGGMGMAAMTLRPNEDMPIDRWAVGNSYAPVLEPLHVSLLNLILEINPLLHRPREDKSSHAFLEYNLLFPVGSAHRSDDAPSRSWTKGRHSPATFPRVSTLLVISRDFPWIIPVDASRPQGGVTCHDILTALHAALKDKLSKSLWRKLTRSKQRELGDRYHRNRSTWRGAPGGDLGSGIRRIDYLCDKVVWDGLTGGADEKEFINKKMGVVGKGWKVSLPPPMDMMGGALPATAPSAAAEEFGWPAVLVVNLDVTGIPVGDEPRMVREEARGTPGPRVRVDEVTTEMTTTSTEEE